MIKFARRTPTSFFFRVMFITTLLFSLSACSVQQVAFFDEGSLQMAQDTAIRVDMFFAKMQRKPEEQRTFDASEEEYIEVAVLLNAMLVRNKNRQFNELSTEQVQSLIELWRDEESGHKARNNFPDVLIKLHRQQFQIAFASIMRGEQYKINPINEL